MFDTILFYFDENGKELCVPSSPEDAKRGYPYKPAPRILRAGDVACKGFSLLSTEVGRMPGVQIRRFGMDEKDAWNEDGGPIVMFSIAIPHFCFLMSRVEICGLEDPNMSHAGILHPPYRCCKPIKGVKYATEDEWRALEAMSNTGTYGIGQFQRQKIELYCEGK
jgi:hypothetical protein